MMLRVSYEDIIKKIVNEKGLTRDEIETKIKSKLKQLSDLISKEGAAHIVANELGVKVLEDVSQKSFKINDLVSGLRGVNIAGKIIRVYELREFEREGKKRRVGSFMIGDESGAIRIVVWDETLLEKFGNIKDGLIVKVSGGYVKDNQGYKEIHLGNNSSIVFNPEGVSISDVKVEQPGGEYIKKQLKDLQEGDRNVGVFGTIVQVFDPKFYDACTECNKKVEDGKCAEHGAVTSKPVPILNIFFDDGTNNVRVVFFREQVGEILSLKDEEVILLRNDPGKIEDIKKELLGKQLLIIGRVVKNEMFGRLEFSASKIEEVEPEKLLEELGGEKALKEANVPSEEVSNESMGEIEPPSSFEEENIVEEEVIE